MFKLIGEVFVHVEITRQDTTV